MINPEQIHIGTRLRTNKGEVITVDSISTKRQHRKVGYHNPDDPYHIHYVRLIQCTEIVETPITKELLDINGWSFSYYINTNLPNMAYTSRDGWYAEYSFGSNLLNIWRNVEDVKNSMYSDICIRVCPTAEKLAQAFSLAGIDYKLKQPS